MNSFELLLQGLVGVLQPTNLLFAFAGCLLGTLIGVLPGVGPVAGVAILTPITFAMPPTAAIIMLCAIYYGAMYGGTITAVLVNVPGEAASAVTCLDGYAMAKQGRSGAALAIAAFGSFVGGSIATFGLVILAGPLTKFALSFGPPEFFALMVLGLSLVTGLAGRSLVLGLLSAALGLLIATVGIDPVMGAPRFTFGQVALLDGFGIVPVVMGIFGISEILVNAEAGLTKVYPSKMRGWILTRDDVARSVMPVARGTAIGFFLGLVPGMAGVISSFLSYTVEKRISKTPEKFGQGMIEGVAGPETANNAFANAALIPLLVLGIPGSPTTAMIMQAFMMNGLTPGPMLFVQNPDIVWTVIASFLVGNVILVILNVPCVPLWTSLLKIPYSVLLSTVLAFCIVGSYSVKNSVFDVGAMVAFGVLGYVFSKLDIPKAPLVLTLILGPLLERGLRRSLEMSEGSFSIFASRPITTSLLVLAGLVIVSSGFRAFRPVRGEDNEL